MKSVLIYAALAALVVAGVFLYSNPPLRSALISIAICGAALFVVWRALKG